MELDILIVVIVLGSAAVLFVTNLIRSDLVALLVMVSLMLSGVITVEQSLAGLAAPVVMIMIVMFIVSEALVNTGLAQKIGRLVLNAGHGSETKLIAFLMLAIGITGAFMSSTAAMAIFIPVALSISRKSGINRKRLLMPLSVGALTSGMMTLIATTPNLVVYQTLKANDMRPLGFFSFTPFGLAALVLGIGFMLVVGRKMLGPKEQDASGVYQRSIKDLAESYGLTERFARLYVSPESPLVDKTVARLRFRQIIDTNLLAIERRHKGKRYFMQIMPETIIKARDAILVIGNKQQLEHLIETQKLTRMPLLDESGLQGLIQTGGLAEIMLAPESKLIGQTFQELNFRSTYQVTVLAVRRRNEALIENLHELKLDFGDTLLVSASWKHIANLKSERQNFIVLTLPEEYHDIAPAQKKAPWAIGILAAMVTTMALGLLPTVTTAMLAGLALLATGCVRIDSIYRVVGWQAVVLVAGILPLATALQTTGADRYIASTMVAMLSPLGPHGMLAVIFLFTAVIGFFLSNTATAILIAPIAIDTAMNVGASPHAFAMTVAIACSAAYVTPVSSPVNMLVYEPGGYHFMDFVKVGMPLLLLTMVATVLMAAILYP